MKRTMVAAGLAVFLAAGIGMAAEHPGSSVEHPGEAVRKEQKAISAATVKDAIREHVKAQSKATGAFVVRDGKLGKEWRLKLTRIHDPVRKFEKNGETIYFTCSDFTALDSSDVLDIDFWMVQKGGGVEVIDTKIHKVNGEPRYGYEGTEIREVK